MVRVMVQLTNEQKKALEELAKQRKTSVAKLVRESVTQYVVAAPRELSHEEKRRRALAAVEYIRDHPGQFRDIEQKPDVSVNHDQYLEEAYS